jgi:hypothetical protein
MRRYVPPPPATPRVERRHIPGGLAGTRTTVEHVARLIRNGARDFYVRQKAIDILLARRVPAKDYLGEIDALFRWVQRNVRYTKDPFRIEVLHSARRLLELRAGDCDDMTILLGALVKSVGHPVRIVLTGPDAGRPDLFSHIYLEAQHRGQWIPLDATMPHAMGWSPRAPVRHVLSIEEESTHDRSASSFTTSRSTTSSSRAKSDSRAQPRLAARPAPRDTSRRHSTARSAREGVVGAAAAAAAARAEPVDARSAAIHLAAGAQRAPSSPYHAAHAGAAQELGGTECATAAAPRRDRSSHAGIAAPVAAPSAGRAPARGDTAPDAGAALEGPRALSASLHDAAALYRRFTQFPAHSCRRIAHPRLLPPVVVELGRLVALAYRSDKWVGRPHTFIHFMKDPPRLVCDVTGRRLFVVGGSYQVTARGIEG